MLWHIPIYPTGARSVPLVVTTIVAILASGICYFWWEHSSLPRAKSTELNTDSQEKDENKDVDI
jgi:hypothetical protein